ncbi:MAG: SDR family NAD(P)-dependent oxidoreductase [Flavobacteriaceae bacterium]
MAAPAHVWITGASSGIGAALAALYARRGSRVTVSARSADGLAAVAGGSRLIFAAPLDVTDPEACRKTVELVDGDAPVDLAVLAAGTYAPVEASALDPEVFAATVAVNYLGVVNSIAAVLPHMLRRGRGVIAIVASLTAYRGLPKAAAYGPTKAALNNLAETLHAELSPHGIRVVVVNPGFVATPMTAGNDFRMPFLMTPQAAARRIAEGIDGGRFEIAFPTRLRLMLAAARLMPDALYFRLVGRLRGKGA